MDAAEFDGWLSRIAGLTPPQRQQAWQTLALSEAADCDDSETGPLWDVDMAISGPATTLEQPPITTLWPMAQPLNRPGSVVVAELGQRRVDSIGCPHCDSRDIVHWGKASALPLQRLSADVQRLDENAIGWFAHEGQMACTGRGHDRRCQHR